MASQTLRSTFTNQLQSPGNVVSMDRDLPTLLNVLNPVAHKCIDIGIQCGVVENDISNMEYNCTDCKTLLRKIITHRLKQLPPLTWCDIVQALRSNSVQEKRLASDIESRYIKQSSVSAASQLRAPCVPTQASLQTTQGNQSAREPLQLSSTPPPFSRCSTPLPTPQSPHPGPQLQPPTHNQHQYSLLPQSMPLPSYPGGGAFPFPPSNESALGTCTSQCQPTLSNPDSASPTPIGRSDQQFIVQLSHGQHRVPPTHPESALGTCTSQRQPTLSNPDTASPTPTGRPDQQFIVQLSHGQHRVPPTHPPPHYQHTDQWNHNDLAPLNEALYSMHNHPVYHHQNTDQWWHHEPMLSRPFHPPLMPHQLYPPYQPHPPHRPPTHYTCPSPNVPYPYAPMHANFHHTHHHTYSTPHPSGHEHGAFSVSGPPQPKKMCHDSPVAQYIRYIKTIYRSSEVERDPKVTKWPRTPSKIFINLVCIDRESVVTKQEADEITQCMICDGNVDVILKKKRPIEFSDIARHLPHTAVKKVVLVEGAPGVGKSTFAWEFSRRWERGDVAQKYQLVLLLRLRDQRISKAQSLSDLVYHSSDHICKAVVQELESTLGVNTLIILEGFDELHSTCRAQSSIFLQLIHGQLLPLATVLVTSRPWATQDLHRECSHRIFQHIEILGFTGKQIDEYVASVFMEEEAEEVMSYIRRCPQIEACMYIPLNAAIVVSVYQESKAGKCILPKTLTELYSALIQALLLRYLYGNPEHGQRRWKIQFLKKDLPPDVYSKLLAVSELAYSGICTIQEGSVQLIFTDLPPDFETLGLMQCVSQLYVTQGEDVSYNFLHLTVQEFLAALHISNMSPEKQLKHFQRQKEGRLRVILRFLAGLTELAKFSPEDLRSLLLEKPNEDQTAKWWDKYSITSDVLLSVEHVNWMFETQKDDIAPLVLQKKTVEFRGHHGLTPLDYYSLGYCIVHSHSQWVLTIETGVVEEEEVRMLVAGANIRRCTTAKEVVLRGGQKDEENGDGYHALSISAEALNVLFTALRRVIHLQELHLELPVECHSIAWPNLQVLHLVMVSEKDWKLDTILSLLSLESLTIELRSIWGDNAIVAHEDCAAIGMLLSSSSCLKCLHFRCNSNLFIDAEGMESIIKVTFDQRCAPLESLVVECKCMFSDTAAHSLVQLITKSTNLHHLSIGVCTFSARGLLELAQAIHHSSSLQRRKLVVKCAVDGDDEATDWAQLLEHYSHIVDWLLDVNPSHITDKGAQSIATALSHNSTLKWLLLHNNSISDRGSAALAQALHHNYTLERLYLSHNSISDSGSTDLAQALHHNSTLEVLDLSGNNAISEEGTHQLVQALTVNTSIIHLFLPSRCEDYATNCPQYSPVKRRIRFL